MNLRDRILHWIKKCKIKLEFYNAGMLANLLVASGAPGWPKIAGKNSGWMRRWLGHAQRSLNGIWGMTEVRGVRWWHPKKIRITAINFHCNKTATNGHRLGSTSNDHGGTWVYNGEKKNCNPQHYMFVTTGMCVIYPGGKPRMLQSQ